MTEFKVSKVFLVDGNSKVKANFSVTVVDVDETGENPSYDLLCCTGFSLVEGTNGFFLSCPSKKNTSGEYKDITFPLSKDVRDELTAIAISAYENELTQKQAAAGGNSSRSRRRS